MPPRYRVISIGTLSQHPLWAHPGPRRTAHATTTLISVGDRKLLVDPALPSQALEARLAERSGLTLADITDVFLTNFRPAHRMGLAAFEHAQWWIFETEREYVGRLLVAGFDASQDAEDRALHRQDITLLQRCQPAPDKLLPGVDLFPSPGFTPGTCGLLLPMPQLTVLVAGDAIPTLEHLERGQVLEGGYDLEQARESFTEAIEIADVIIPGHDNIALNPLRRTP